MKVVGFEKCYIVYIDIVFVDLNDFNEVNVLYMLFFFEGKCLVRMVYEVVRLFFDGKVKIVVMVVKESGLVIN